MSQNYGNKSRTQILDLIDESSQASELTRTDIQLINGGARCVCILVACSSAAGGGYDYD